MHNFKILHTLVNIVVSKDSKVVKKQFINNNQGVKRLGTAKTIEYFSAEPEVKEKKKEELRACSVVFRKTK